jgi:tRNA-5-methyluridine54 2-sulfurtransferase
VKCSLCSQRAVFSRYCKEHFTEYFEKKAKDTIRRFRLLKKSDKIAVAVSGGKDSMSLLYMLHKHGYNVTGLAVDEGIHGYRDKTLLTLSEFCKKNKILLNIVSFKEMLGKTLDEINPERPCSVCGVYRRYILNMHAKGFDALATGHNMDDEAQAIIMNLTRNSIPLLKRLGPVSGTGTGFTKRVKPFYLCPEKEVMVYSFLNNLNTEFTECPNIERAYRLRIRDMLNDYELSNQGTKRNIVEWFISIKPKLKVRGSHSLCKRCGEPSAKEVCSACAMAYFFKEIKTF